MRLLLGFTVDCFVWKLGFVVWYDFVVCYGADVCFGYFVYVLLGFILCGVVLRLRVYVIIRFLFMCANSRFGSFVFCLCVTINLMYERIWWMFILHCLLFVLFDDFVSVDFIVLIDMLWTYYWACCGGCGFCFCLFGFGFQVCFALFGLLVLVFCVWFVYLFVDCDACVNCCFALCLLWFGVWTFWWVLLVFVYGRYCLLVDCRYLIVGLVGCWIADFTYFLLVLGWLLVTVVWGFVWLIGAGCLLDDAFFLGFWLLFLILLLVVYWCFVCTFDVCYYMRLCWLLGLVACCFNCGKLVVRGFVWLVLLCYFVVLVGVLLILMCFDYRLV